MAINQLSGLDAAFVNQESRVTPMHITPVLLLGPDPGGGKPLSLEALKIAFNNCLKYCPVLSQKLVKVPMRMDEPYWVKDHAFALHQHIKQSSLAPPGNWSQLKQVLAKAHGTGLDMAKPLWSAELITDLNDIDVLPQGGCAVILKVHHAGIDGVTLSRLIGALYGELPADTAELPLGNDTPLDRIEIWNRASMKSWSRPIKLLDTLSNVLPAASKLRREDKPKPASSEVKLTKTRFNTSVTSTRQVGAINIPMADMHTIKKNVRRITLNDIVISIVGGALREYLSQHNELPDTSLACGAPINLRQKDDLAMGNKIATMQIGLATDIADPIERVRAVHQYAVLGKSRINKLGTGTVMDISDSLNPGMLAEGLRALNFVLRIADLPVPFHVMISNVPGPTTPVNLQGCPLHNVLGFGPIRHTMGLFHVITQSPGWQTINFSSCKTMLPDAEFYEQCLRNSYESLINSCGS